MDVTSDDLCVILFNLLDNAMEACLRNVREKVEKYNGSLEIEVEKDMFTVTALLFFE